MILWRLCLLGSIFHSFIFFPLQIEKTVMFQTGCLNVTSQLAKLKKFQSRVILFSARFVPSIGGRWRTGWAKKGHTASAWQSFCNVKLRSQENCYFFHPIFVVINIIWVAPLLCPIPTAFSLFRFLFSHLHVSFPPIWALTSFQKAKILQLLFL